MSAKILIILVDDKNKEREEQCRKSIEAQSYKAIDTVVISNLYQSMDICGILQRNAAEYALFIHSDDRIGVDYCRTLVNKAQEGADIVAGEHLELIRGDLFFPNRTFNQNELQLHNDEIVEVYSKLSRLDNSWTVLWNKLYKKDLLIRALQKINGDCKSEEELSIRINNYIFQHASCFVNAKNDYYYRYCTRFPQDTYFSKRYVKINGPLYFEEIKKAILNPQVKVVSFDIFDTLLLRPFLYPTDLFIMLDQYVNSLICTIDGIGFQKLRILAEISARQKLCERKEIQDVTLEQIYNELAQQCSLLIPYLDNIKNKEISLELQYCYQRRSGKELYDLARYTGKRVIYTSDMYLPSAVIKQLLEKNGYSSRDIFVSNEVGKTKSTGDLYQYVVEKLGSHPSEVVHIGDNKETDVINAITRGLQAFHLPRTEELFNNWNQEIYTGRYFSNMFESRCGIVQNYDAKELFGIRCMIAVCANKMYDYPFVIYDRSSDFNGNPYKIGYFTLGMHLYAVARWLIEQCKYDGYDNLHFMARDGYLVKEAFQALSGIFDNRTKIYYTYMSRKALMPLMLQSKEDCYNLLNSFNGINILPEVIFRVIAPVIKEENKDTLAAMCKNIGIDFEKPLGSRENFLKLSELVATELFDERKARKFRNEFARCFDAQFAGKTGTFDMGYSARGESILKEVFNYNITANYMHTCLDKAYQRELKSDVKVNCFYDFTPYISGIARELLMSELSGSCIGYQFQNGKAIPLFEEFETDFRTYYAVHFMQDGALDFVKDMINIFGEYNKKLLIRNFYASIPFDYYLAYSHPYDRSFFSDTVFEDDMGLGNEINFERFWDDMIHRMMEGNLSKIDYNSYGKIRRYLLIILHGDLGELKVRVREKLYRHRIVYYMAKAGYNGMKQIYHKVCG